MDIELILGVRILVFIIVSAAEIIQVTTFFYGKPPTKSHHWIKALVTKYHLSFVSYSICKYINTPASDQNEEFGEGVLELVSRPIISLLSSTCRAVGTK
jgi:hypothetical protein